MAGNRGVTPPLGSCAAMLFLGSVMEMDISNEGADLVVNLIQRPPIRENLQAGPHRDAVRRLVAGWILLCPNQHEGILSRRLVIASMNQIDEAIPLALDVALGERKYARVQPVTRAIAILVVGQLGGGEHIGQLESLLDDDTVCSPVGPGQATTSVQIRDVALVVMLHLSGQQPADYGYVHARIQPQQLFQLETLSAGTEQQRDQAIAQWRAWRAEQRRDSQGQANSSRPGNSQN
jgi:hypothetical protein